jgi:Enolase C-terminal domain-like
VRAAVGPAVELRCDANRGWGLAAATAFGLAAAPARLQYVEEPVADPAADLAAFLSATGLPTALDESVDAGEALNPTAGRVPATQACVDKGSASLEPSAPREDVLWLGLDWSGCGVTCRRGVLSIQGWSDRGPLTSGCCRAPGWRRWWSSRRWWADLRRRWESCAGRTAAGRR